MTIDAELVSRVARLAALELTPEESRSLALQLTRIVEHFESLGEIPDTLLEELSSPAPSPLRADAVVPDPPGELLDENAPEIAHGHFVVPRVVARG